MEYRHLGHTGLRVSEVALGAWLTLGSSVDRAATRELVQLAFDLGINLFDSADVYASGEGEQALGEALRELPRQHLVLATKCFFPMSAHPNDRGLSRKHLFESVEGSLRRLGTDYIDLYQCHRADPDTPLDETVRAFDDLVHQGKILYWGVSEWPADAIRRACDEADTWRAQRPVSSQPQYSILRRGIERDILPACRELGIGQLVWSPLAQGALTGKYRGGARPADSRGADGFRNQFMADFLAPECLQRIDALRPLAAEAGLSMAQLAVAWCLRDAGVSSAIVGATRGAQLEDTARASGRRLPAEIIDGIDALFPFVSQPEA